MPKSNKGPKQKEQAVKRRRAVLRTAGLCVLFYLLLSFFLGDMGMVRYVKLQRQRTRLVAEISALKASNEELRKEVEALRTDPDYIERLAREQGLVKEGELIYQYEDE